jgi:hypothetical protein
MRVKLILPLFVVALLASVFTPRPAHTQQRGLGVAQTPPASHYYALVIGNDDYASLPKLKTAAADAREVERVLHESYGFQTQLLVNAKRAQIIAALSSYRRVLDTNANLLIYYAGHGYNDKDADKAYWLPVDAAIDDTSNWIIADEITTSIRVIPARHIIVISDSCYSGTLTRDLNISLPRPSEREQFLQRMAAGHSRTLMASGGNEPVADGRGSGHSIFAAALLRGLQMMDKPQFTAAELFNNYIVESVAGRAEQTPVYDPLRNSGHESGDFVFARVSSNAKPVEAIVNAPPATKIDQAQQELAFWNSIQNSTDAEDFKDYLARYPNGLYVSIARRRVQAMNSKTSQPMPDQLIAKSDSAPVPTHAVTLRFDGLYRSDKITETEWMRFYEDGTALWIHTAHYGAEVAYDIAKWFKKESDKGFLLRGTYKYTGTGVYNNTDVGTYIQLSFPSATSYGKQFECTAMVSRGGTSFLVNADLNLERISNGYSVYEFIKLDRL